LFLRGIRWICRSCNRREEDGGRRRRRRRRRSRRQLRLEIANIADIALVLIFKYIPNITNRFSVLFLGAYSD
jgi:hypothetical protein